MGIFDPLGESAVMQMVIDRSVRCTLGGVEIEYQNTSRYQCCLLDNGDFDTSPLLWAAFQVETSPPVFL